MAVRMKAEETEELTTHVGVRDQHLQVDEANDKQIMVIITLGARDYFFREIEREIRGGAKKK